MFSHDPYDQHPDKKKWIIAIAGGFVLLVIITAIMVMVWKNREASRQKTAELKAEIQSQINARCADGPQGTCAQRAVEKIAVEMGDSGVCAELKDKAFDDCVWKIARTLKDPEKCKEIKAGDTEQKCLQGVSSNLALENRDVSYCKMIPVSEDRELCESAINSMKERSECAPESTSEVCQNLRIISEAKQKRDPGICDQIKDMSYQFRCKDSVSVPDVDLDGLDLAQEIYYGTSDTNPDSDADGFGDLAELQAGYNPAGAGKLPAEKLPL